MTTKALTREEKRALFERGIETVRKAGIANFPLHTLQVNGQFHHYMDSDTDSAWIGFQLAFNAIATPPAKRAPDLKEAA